MARNVKSAPPQGKDSSANLGFEAKGPVRKDLAAEQAAPAPHVDMAEYKSARPEGLVLGLIFLKYNSDTFDEHHAKLDASANPGESTAGAWPAGQRSRVSRRLAGTIGGSAQPDASAQTLAATSLVFPTGEVADAYYRAVRPLDLRRAANDRESRTLATLRDTLLPKLLSGKLSVAQKQN